MNLQFLPGYGPDVNLKLEFSPDSLDPTEIDPFARAMLTAKGASYARLYDVRYDRFQNEVLVSTFEMLNESTEGFTTTWSPILREDVVLTAHNPGRNNPGATCTEALGHEMWLGTAFWKLTGARASQVKVAFPTRDLAEEVLAARLSEREFSRANPPSDRMWKTLFPKSRPVSRRVPGLPDHSL